MDSIGGDHQLVLIVVEGLELGQSGIDILYLSPGLSVNIENEDIILLVGDVLDPSK